MRRPAFPPTRVQAPFDEGVGLNIPERVIPSAWPQDWWQRNYDDAWDPDALDPVPLTARQMRVPPPPVAA